MPALNYTTTIPAERTMAECQGMLGKHGASHVSIAYEDGEASGLAFGLRTPHGERTFTLPVDVDAVHQLLLRQLDSGELRPHMKVQVVRSRAHAANVAWRVVKDWLEAQLALLEAQMATLDQVMLPYLNVEGNQTLYAAYKEREAAASLALEGPR